MKRRPFKRSLLRLVLPVLTALGIVSSASRAWSQEQTADQAALFLLLPVGARAVGVGNATTSASGTSDAVWWNPAGLSTVRGRDASLHHSQSLIGTDDALSIAWGTPKLGVVAVSANLLDFGGEIPAVDNTGTVVGRILSRNLALIGSYATAIGPRFRAGVSYKRVQFRFDCDGLCPTLPTTQASTTALDLGTQYQLTKGSKFPVTLGAVVRNLDIRLRSRPRVDSDRLPTRLQIGAMTRYAIPKDIATEAEIRVAADLIYQFPLGRPLPRIGTEFVWEKRAFVRAGYVVESTDTESGGPTLGLGFVVGRLVIDFARVFTGLSADAGQAPTYLSLRVTF